MQICSRTGDICINNDVIICDNINSFLCDSKEWWSRERNKIKYLNQEKLVFYFNDNIYWNKRRQQEWNTLGV